VSQLAAAGPRRAVVVAREEGLRSLAVKVLAATCYSRLVLFGRRLDDPIPDVDSRLELAYSLLSADDIDDYVRLVPGASAMQIRARLSQGQRCFAVRHDGRLVAVSWALTGRVHVPYLRASLRLERDEALIAEAYVAPELRGLGVSSSAGRHRLTWLRDAGYRRVMAAILAENRLAFSPPERLGYERWGTVYSFGIGQLRRAVLARRHRGRVASRLRQLALEAGLAAASYHRRSLRGVTFIGVTGSCGKTTTKELIFAALSGRLPGRKNPKSYNSFADVGRTVLRTSSRDRFCVVEVAAWERGSVARSAAVLRPQIAVVTTVGRDHHRAFRTLEATAAEKRALLDAVVDGGSAVLNADDPHVCGMAQGFRGRVITFGRRPGATLRAEDVRSGWPERLSFTLELEGRTLPIRTNLCGEHWVTGVLAALAVAYAMGLPMDQTADALASAQPVPGRMSPIHINGATLIRDDVKSPLWAVDAALDFLAQAQAERKLAVIGSLSDYASPATRVYRSVAGRALSVADEVLFVGPNSRHATKSGDSRVHALESVPAATAYLQAHLRAGDLVLLKGTLADGFQEISRTLEQRA